MEEANGTRYWCHMCSLTVNPVMEDEIKCPLCRSGFVEEMAEEEEEENHHHSSSYGNEATNTNILMEMLINFNETGGDGRAADLNSQLQEILWRRRRRSSSVSAVQLLRAGSTLEDERGGGVIFISPRSQIIAVPSSVVTDSSLSDYFIGPGFEALLQRLAENDPNRYGTPPARKQDVESLPSVKIQEASLQCSVCLDDFEIGVEAKQMPCKHSFHPDCLLPWLELHSSCPVCRYQLPTDDTKTTDSPTTEETDDNNNSSESSSTSSNQGTENSDGNHQEEEEEDNDDGGGRIGFSIPWPFSSLFSSSSQDSNPSRGTD